VFASQPAPLWLWRIAVWAFGISVMSVAGLTWALASGLADPPRAGPLLRYDNFQTSADQWEFIAPAGGTLAPHEGGLIAEFPARAADQWAIGLTNGPLGDFTLEVAGTQISGEAAYGLIFAWQDKAHYSAVLINGNGYAEVYRQEGTARTDWFQWQQWPNILLGTESNRVRIDIRGTRLTARVNDEVLAEGATTGGGKIGVIARSSAPSRVVFNWIQVWGRP
jgi:hypothetical protein